MKYLIARQVASEGQKHLSSTFAAVIEPVKGKGSIQSSQPLNPLTPNPDFAGARIEYLDENGTLKTDYVLSGMGAKTSVKLPEGMEFTGQFGVASEDRLFLVNGSKLRVGPYLLEAKPIPAKIVEVNAARNEITLDALIPSSGLPGKVITISNPMHSTSYTIQTATNREGRTVLNFGDVLPIIGEGHVTRVDAVKGRVTTDTVLTGHARVDGGKHEGRWLTDSKRTIARKIKKFDGTVFTLEGKIPAGAFADGRFLILDFSIGDKVEVPSIQSVRRDSEGQYHIQSTLPFKLTVPADGGAHSMKQGAEWQPVESKVVNGKLTVSIDPAAFVNGETILKRTDR
jgi:hypothetical protein